MKVGVALIHESVKGLITLSLQTITQSIVKLEEGHN